MKSRVGLFALLISFSLFPASTLGQQQAIGLGMNQGGLEGSTSSGDAMNALTYLPELHKNLACRVYSSKGGILPKATVEITNNAGSPFQYYVTDKDGDFQSVFNLFDPAMGRHFIAFIKVSKKGFQVAHKIVQMDQKTNELSFVITLRPSEPEDPNLLSQADLVKALSPRLLQLGPADGLAAKVQKDYARGVQEFLDGKHMDKAVIDLANAAALSPLCLKCRTMLGLAEMSWGDWDDSRREFGESVNAIIKDQKWEVPNPCWPMGRW